MESVSHVAPQGRHFVALLEVLLADRALVDAPETAIVVRDFWRVVDDVLTGAALSGPLVVVVAKAVDDAWAEDDKDGDYAHHDEGLREDETDDNREDEETEARVGVVAVRCEALECAQAVDGPGRVEHP